jgi:hypothetical protein
LSNSFNNTLVAQQQIAEQAQPPAQGSEPQASQAPPTPPASPNPPPLFIKALDLLKEKERKLYDSWENTIQTLQGNEYNYLSSRFTPERLNESESKKQRNAYILRLQKCLPPWGTIKAVSMTLSNLDPHKIAPVVCAVVFFAFEVRLPCSIQSGSPLTISLSQCSLGIVNPDLRDKILNLLIHTSIIIERWLRYEEFFMKDIKSAVAHEMGELKKSLPSLYLDGLMILCSIHESSRIKSELKGTL